MNTVLVSFRHLNLFNQLTTYDERTMGAFNQHH